MAVADSLILPEEQANLKCLEAGFETKLKAVSLALTRGLLRG